MPIFRAECVLGFVLGLTNSFGGVLPVFIATILSVIGAVVYLVPRVVTRQVRKRWRAASAAKRAARRQRVAATRLDFTVMRPPHSTRRPRR